jgi:hypothetical protein
MKYFGSKNFERALRAIGVLYTDKNQNLSNEERKMVFEIMNELLVAYSAYCQRQQHKEAEYLLHGLLQEGHISAAEAKFLRKTLRNELSDRP